MMYDLTKKRDNVRDLPVSAFSTEDAREIWLVQQRKREKELRQRQKEAVSKLHEFKVVMPNVDGSESAGASMHISATNGDSSLALHEKAGPCRLADTNKDNTGIFAQNVECKLRVSESRQDVAGDYPKSDELSAILTPLVSARAVNEQAEQQRDSEIEELNQAVASLQREIFGPGRNPVQAEIVPEQSWWDKYGTTVVLVGLTFGVGALVGIRAHRR